MHRLSAAWLSYTTDIDEKHLDVLDGVRVMMVGMVMWFHIWQQSWLYPSITLFGMTQSVEFMPRSGYIFVDGMLLLSGLLLYLPIAPKSARMPKTLSFYKRRLIRILPSYLLCIVVMLVFYAWPKGSYASTGAMLKDVAAHLTFTHNLFAFSYTQTPLNGALWTLAVEMQFYLIFPLLARAFKRKPLLTFCAMTGCAFLYRAYVMTLSDTTLYVNQLPAFMDVYAVGFVAAMAIDRLRARFKNEQRIEKLAFSVFAMLSFAALISLQQMQAASVGYEQMRIGQMVHRFPLAVVLAALMVSLCFSLPVLRFLFGNRLMHLLSLISFQVYIWHQVLAVRLKEWGIPASQSDQPWSMMERAWQENYTLICFLGALVIAAVVTFVFELPLARRLRKK